MTFPISSPLGAYQITNLTFSPSTIVPGESTKMTVTVKNTSGMKITKMYVHTTLFLPATNSSGYISSAPVYLYGTGDFSKDYGMSSVSWANGASMTFTKEICPTFSTSQLAYLTDTYHFGAVTMSGQKWGLLFGIVPNEMVTGTSNTDNFYNVNYQGETDELLHILSTRDNPKLSLNVDRATNGALDDEGVNLLTDVQLSCDSTSSVFQSHGYSVSIACTPTPSGGCVFGATIAQMLAGITDGTSTISGTFNNGTDYSITLTVSNGYESVSATVTILKSFANVHMSGMSTGGVCFGGFSSATEGNPKFECYYPAYFYGGIEQGLCETVSLSVETGFSSPGDYGHALRLTRIGTMVFITGTIKRTKSGSTVICVLPSGWAPPNKHEYIFCVGTGHNIARLCVHYVGNSDTYPTGYIDIEWFNSCSSTSNSSSTFTWLSVNGMWSLEE